MTTIPLTEHKVAIMIDNLLQNKWLQDRISSLEQDALIQAVKYLNAIDPTKRFLSGVEPKPESGLTT